MKEQARILIIDDEESIRFGFGSFLRTQGYGILEADSGAHGLAVADTQSPDLVVLDMKLPDMDGIEVLQQLKAQNEFTVVIMVTAFGTIEKAVKALKLGAENFLTKPFDPESLLILIEHALKIHNFRKQEVLNELMRKDEDGFFISASSRMLKVQELARVVAKDPTVTVLIEGETGTGKGMWARWIHGHSERSARPLVEVNCAGLSKELLESELFGHEKGAFTGAVGSKSGLVEVANGGTLFLDEISEMELAVQSKVLKVLEEKKFRRLGAIQEKYSDVRLIAASNKNLEKAVQEGRFREDLFYRLNVMALALPPLRERKADIASLAELFLAQMARQKSSQIPVISEDAMALLEGYHWPGNLRELKNLLERALILCKQNQIGPELFPIQRKVALQGPLPAGPLIPLREVELNYIRHVLKTVDNNYRKAAQILGVNRNTLYNRLREKPEKAAPNSDSEE